MSAADRWLEERISGIPETLASHLDRTEGGEGVVEPLLRRGLAALSGARARTGPNREGAFRLLAADAYLTYACEAAAESDEPGAALEEILSRVASAPE